MACAIKSSAQIFKAWAPRSSNPSRSKAAASPIPVSLPTASLASPRMKNKIFAVAMAVTSLAIAFSLVSGKGMLPLPPFVPVTLRWLAIALITANAIQRRSLTPWILVGLLAGAEVGHDFPSFATNLQFLGIIFLRLIRVIIAPLLFGTLVVGIAGHADLKKVGRLGLKSLVYFEIVSTIALLIGFVPININPAATAVR